MRSNVLIFRGFRYKILYGVIFLALVLLDKTTALAAFLSGLMTYLLMNNDYRKAILILVFLSVAGLFYAFTHPEFYSLNGMDRDWETY